MKEAITLLSFTIHDDEAEEEAKERYYQDISENRLATIIKILNRCNNISTMEFGISREKMMKYMAETEKYVLPLLECMRINYPECYDAAFLLKYQMLSLLEILKRTIV